MKTEAQRPRPTTEVMASEHPCSNLGALSGPGSLDHQEMETWLLLDIQLSPSGDPLSHHISHLTQFFGGVGDRMLVLLSSQR